MKTEIDQPKSQDSPISATAIEPDDDKHVLEEAVQTSMLLRLSAEIRNTIYEFCFLSTVVRVQTDKKNTTKDTTEPPRYQSSVGLLFTCRQLRWEATPFFQAHSIIDFQEKWPRHVEQVIPREACVAIQLIRIAPVDYEDLMITVFCMRPLFKAGGSLESVRKFTVRDGPKSWFPPRSVVEAEAEHWKFLKEENDENKRKLEMEMEYYAENGEEPLTFSRELSMAF